MDKSWLRCRIHPDRDPTADSWAWVLNSKIEDELKAKLSGAELWLFSSPQEHWDSLCGRGGYAVVRDGEIVNTVETVMN